MNHKNDKVCSCFFCTLIDVVWGDPLLNVWEKSFIESVARSGWIYEYTQKQKAKIKQTYQRMLRLRNITK